MCIAVDLQGHSIEAAFRARWSISKVSSYMCNAGRHLFFTDLDLVIHLGPLVAAKAQSKSTNVLPHAKLGGACAEPKLLAAPMDRDDQALPAEAGGVLSREGARKGTYESAFGPMRAPTALHAHLPRFLRWQAQLRAEML